MPERNDTAKETSGPWEGWRLDPIVELPPGWSVEAHQAPSFTFTSPDGQKYTVTGPDGATLEQAFAILQGRLRSDAGDTSGDDAWWREAPIVEPAPPAASEPCNFPFKVDPEGLSEHEIAVLEEVFAEVNSTDFLADLSIFEPGKPDPRICTEACWAASGFDQFLHGPH